MISKNMLFVWGKLLVVAFTKLQFRGYSGLFDLAQVIIGVR